MMCFKGCFFYLFSLILVFFQTPIDPKSSIDTVIAAEIVQWIVLKTENLGTENNFKIISENENFTQFLEEEFIKKNGRLVQLSDSLTILFSIATKGEFAMYNAQVKMEGIALIKVIQLNQILESKRVLINKIVKNDYELESVFWVEKQVQEKKNTVRKWIEPSLILSAMLLSVYLLFSVRS